MSVNDIKLGECINKGFKCLNKDNTMSALEYFQAAIDIDNENIETSKVLYEVWKKLGKWIKHRNHRIRRLHCRQRKAILQKQHYKYPRRIESYVEKNQGSPHISLLKVLH